LVINQSSTYGTWRDPAFSAHSGVTAKNDPFTIPFNPAATPGPTSTNARPFKVEQVTDVLDVFANVSFLGVTNPVGIILTDPNSVTYSSGIGLPLLNAPSRQVLVKNPVAGDWTIEVRGVRGVTRHGAS